MSNANTDVLSESDRVRHYVEVHYLEPAKKRGDRAVTIVAGDIHRALGLVNRVPLVCSALKSQRFHEANHVVLSDVSGPPSKLSTTVRFTFTFVPGDARQGANTRNPFWELRGIAKGLFGKPGDWEASIMKDRQEMADAFDKMNRR